MHENGRHSIDFHFHPRAMGRAGMAEGNSAGSCLDSWGCYYPELLLAPDFRIL